MTVNTNRFVSEMSTLWELPTPQGGLGNISSPALLEAWGVLCRTLNGHSEGKYKDRWNILSLPTGSGKTQALCLYCGLLSDKKTDHPGVLIVTRFTQQADELRDRINEHCRKHGRKESAFAFHSALPADQKLNKPDIQDVPVAIITHSLYSRTLAADLDEPEAGTLAEKYQLWRGNKCRNLIVIDESLDVVEENQIHLDEIRLLRALIPHNKEQKFKTVIHIIDGLIHEMIKYSESSRKREKKRIREHEIIAPSFWKKRGNEPVEDADWEELKSAIAAIDYRNLLALKEDKMLNGVVVQKMTSIIKSIQDSLDSTSWLGHKRGCSFLSAPYISLPTNLRSSVVLDATAKHHHIYKLLQPFTDFVSIPEGIRSYKNVKLHVRTIEAVGKEFLSKKPSLFFKKIINSESKELGKKRAVLMCVHKTTEEKLDKIKPDFRTQRIAHWGSIDGKNDWHNFDTMLIIGLPNFDDVHPNNAFFAFKKWKNKALNLNEPISVNTRDSTDLDRYKFGHMITSLVQAMNRIRCRKVIDRDGNCAETDIVLYLGKRNDHLKIITAIRDMMPEIAIVQADDEDRVEEQASREIQEAVITVFKKLKSGKHDGEKIKQSLERVHGKDISQRTFERVITSLNDPQTWLSIEATRIGVTYSAIKGRYGGRFFIKTKSQIKKLV